MSNKLRTLNWSGLALIVLMLTASVMYADQAVRIPVESDAEVVALIEEGYNLLDVECSDASATVLFRNRENGYVTASLADSQVDRFLMDHSGSMVIEQSYRPEDQPVYESYYSYRWGWPREMMGDPGVFHQVPTVTNLDGLAENEIFLHSIEGYKYIWRDNGGWIPGFPMEPYSPEPGRRWSTHITWETACVADLDGDNTPEFVYGTSYGYLCVMNESIVEEEEQVFYDFGTGVITGIPTAADLDGDSRDEIIINSYSLFSEEPRQGFVHIFSHDGSEWDGWPVSYPNPTSSSPSLGDIDGDGSPEIVIATGQYLETTGAVYAWEVDGTVMNGFPVDGFYSIGGNPSLADVDNDNDLDIILRCAEIGGVNGIFALDETGSVVNGFPIEVEGGHPYGSVAVADMDGNGALDFAVGTVEAPYSGGIYVYEAGIGLRDGFPHRPGSTWIGGSPIFADVDGDGLAEVLASVKSPMASAPFVVAYNSNGNFVGLARIDGLDQETLPGSPTVADLDNNGTFEILSVSNLGRVYIFDTVGIPGASSFPCEKGNFRRSGEASLQSPTTTDTPELEPGSVPSEFSIVQAYPNPFNSTVSLQFDLPSQGRLTAEVYNILGEKVDVILSREMNAGCSSVTWTAAPDLGSGIYFVHAEWNGESRLQRIVFLK